MLGLLLRPHRQLSLPLRRRHRPGTNDLCGIQAQCRDRSGEVVPGGLRLNLALRAVAYFAGQRTDLGVEDFR